MPRARGDDGHDGANENEAVGGRWRRRAARREAERRRMPKRGKAYVELVRRMLARRAAEGAEAGEEASKRRSSYRNR